MILSAVVSTHLAKVNFVKHHLIGVANSPESGDKSQNGGQGEGSPVIALAIGCILLN